MIPKVIGFSGRAGVGKTTCANALSQALGGSVIICPFSAPIKKVASELGWNGVKDDKGRRLLQLLGTEVGRECIGEDIWVLRWMEHTRLWRVGGCIVIADDVRFSNEAAAIHGLGGCVFEIVAPARELNLGTCKDHRSERGIGYHQIDYQLDTSETRKEDLVQVFGGLIERLWMKGEWPCYRE